MNSEENEELVEYFNHWLDTNMSVYGDVLKEWDEMDYVKPFPDAQTTFKCNDCGKCCDFSEHDVWVYPSDIVKWLKDIDTERIIPLLISALLPVQDMDNITGLGLPSQKNLSEQYQVIINQKKNKEIVNTLQGILKQLKQNNPNFSENSNFCVYYNPSPEKGTGHCSIYENRPVQCRSYPYDYPQFTKFVIPENEEKEDLSDIPMCPSDAYDGDIKNGILTNEDQRSLVVMEKANYRTSSVIYDWAQKDEDWKAIAEEEIGDIILELFHKDIVNMDRNMKLVQKTRKNQPTTQRFVAGKRPNKGKTTRNRKK